MSIGQAVTNKFPIGSAEIRVGTLAEANNLTSAHSMGLLNSANVSVSQESVDLLGGLPNTLIDSAITKTVIKVSAQAYEYSRRNIQIALNESIDSAPEVSGTIKATTVASTSGTSQIQVDIPINDLSVGDMLVIYTDKAPENLSTVIVTALASATNTQVTINNLTTPLLFDVNASDHVYKANQVGLGKSSVTHYFSLDVIGLDTLSGQPTGFKFWKVAIESGLDYSYSNDSFALTPISFKVLQPSPVDTLPGQPLAHIVDLVADHPYGMQFSGTEVQSGVFPLSALDGILTDSTGSIITVSA